MVKAIIRIALVENEHRIRQAARNLKKFLAQAPETMHNVIPIHAKSQPLTPSVSMQKPLTLGIAGLGTVGAGLLQLLAPAQGALGGACRPSDAGRRHLGARQGQKTAASTSSGIAWFDDPGGAGARSENRRVRRADRRRGRHRQGSGRGGAQRRQARRHRQQGAARQARRRTRQARRGEGRRAQLRGGGGRRHPRHQDAARIARGQSRCGASTASSTAPAISSSRPWPTSTARSAMC